MVQLKVGDKAPTFRLPNENGEPTSLADFAGRRTIVYFYPKDDTPGCTKEACQFNDLLTDFSNSGVEVVGISPDDAESHRQFQAKYGLNVHLLSDLDHAVMDAYGAWGERLRNGEVTIGVVRSTFVVGPEGEVEFLWYGVDPDGHPAEVRRALAI